MRGRYGMVHGRFQPFHTGHLQYVLSALQRCSHLIIGVTNSDPSTIVQEPTDPNRHRPEANLFTFFERQLMIRAALAEAGIEWTRISIVPFPIHHPDRWAYYCPREATQFMRLFSAWGEEKRRRFQELGWTVEVLDSGSVKDVSGSEVRRRLREEQGWRECVSPAVAVILDEIKAVERLRNGEPVR
jgi:nicotinamide-nucleotide adenylyltransferase